MKWYKAGMIFGFVLMQAIYLYIAIDIYKNIKAGNSIVSDLCAIFAIWAWSNTFKLANKCQQQKQEVPELPKRKFYRLEGN